MTDKRVYIVTGTDLGWDCVVEVFNPTKISLEKLQEQFPRSRQCMIHEKDVEEDLSDWDESDDG